MKLQSINSRLGRIDTKNCLHKLKQMLHGVSNHGPLDGSLNSQKIITEVDPLFKRLDNSKVLIKQHGWREKLHQVFSPLPCIGVTHAFAHVDYTYAKMNYEFNAFLNF
jgi:hypothetical protein